MTFIKGVLSAVIFLVLFLVVGMMLFWGLPANAQVYGVPGGDYERLNKCVILCKKYKMCVLEEGLAREDGDEAEAERYHQLANQKFIRFHQTCSGAGGRESFLWVGGHWYCPDPQGPYSSLYIGIVCR